MAIPGEPAVQDLILNGMKEGGQYTVSAGSTAYTEFKNYQFETLKSELWAACKTDRLLETEAVVLAAVGKPQVTLPTDFDSEIRVVVYDADESYRGTAQAGAASTITLASTFSSTAESMYGRKIFTLSGTGAGYYRDIIDYNDTTKVATVASAWTTTPDSTTTYLVATYDAELRRMDYSKPTRSANRPSVYGILGSTMSVLPAPDKIYPILVMYRTNLTRLDDTGTVFVKHMRERRSLWILGIKLKTMSRYDDDRYPAIKAEWDQALMMYAADNIVYDTMQPNR